MKKMTKNSYLILLSLFVMVTFVNCDKDDTIVGQLRPIGLDKSEFTISSQSQGARIDIHAKELGWYIDRTTEQIGDETKYKENGYTVINGVNTPNKILSGDWYTITQTGRYDLAIEVSDNITGLPRKLVITLAGIGLLWTDITITQE